MCIRVHITSNWARRISTCVSKIKEVYEHFTPSRYIDSSRTESSRSWKFKMVLFDHRFLLRLENRSGCTGFLAKYGNQYTHYHATLGCSRSYWKVRLSSKEKRMPGIPRPRLASIAFNEASAPVPRASVIFRLLISSGPHCYCHYCPRGRN